MINTLENFIYEADFKNQVASELENEAKDIELTQVFLNFCKDRASAGENAKFKTLAYAKVFSYLFSSFLQKNVLTPHELKNYKASKEIYNNVSEIELTKAMVSSFSKEKEALLEFELLLSYFCEQHYVDYEAMLKYLCSAKDIKDIL